MYQKYVPSIGPGGAPCWASLVAIVYSSCNLNGYTYCLQPDLATAIGTQVAKGLG